MKKAIFSALSIAAMASMATAQTPGTTTVTETMTVTEEIVTPMENTHRVITNPIWNNWFLQAGAGAQISFTDHDRQCKLGDRISPALNISVGKWLTPGVAMRLTYSGLYSKGATQTWLKEGIHSTGEPVPGKYTHDYGYLEKSKFDYLNLHLDVMFNMCNLIGGYNPDRLYSCIPYVGFGWAHVWDSPKANEFTGNVGVSNAFRLSRAFDINLDINCMVADDRFSGGSAGRHYDALLNVTLGVTWKIGGSSWERPYSMTRTVVDNSAVNDLRGRLNASESENARLQAELAKKRAETSARVDRLIASGNIVFFDIDSDKLSDKARASLSFLAKAINNSEGKYSVSGYADKGTGSATWNEKLSLQRAEAVRDCLVNEFGVKADRLHVEAKGGVDDMFYNDPRCSRAVIVLPD